MSWFLINRNLTPLEPYDWKLSSTVLRGERGSNAPDLPGNIESSLKRTGEKAGCNVHVSPHTAKYTFANDKKQVFLSLKHLITSTEQIMSASMSFLS